MTNNRQNASLLRNQLYPEDPEVWGSRILVSKIMDAIADVSRELYAKVNCRAPATETERAQSPSPRVCGACCAACIHPTAASHTMHALLPSARCIAFCPISFVVDRDEHSFSSPGSSVEDVPCSHTVKPPAADSAL